MRFITTQKIDFIWFIKVKRTGPAQCRACFFVKNHGFLIKKATFYYLCHMRRQFLFILILLCCTMHFLSGSGSYAVTRPLSVDYPATASPLSACRYKRPFPFQCVQLTKKRLSSPPLPGQSNIYPGCFFSSTLLFDAPACFLYAFSGIPTEWNKCRPAPLAPGRRHSCGIQRNVFHPPPQGATQQYL